MWHKRRKTDCRQPITKTIHKKVFWRGQGQAFSLINTPGLNAKEKNEETVTLCQMIDELKKYNELHVIVIVINGESPRFDQNRKQMVKKFQQMFGKHFLEKKHNLCCYTLAF